MSANRNKGKGSELVELDDRKWKIFTAIIKNYLETGEPVGSRTISKYTDLNLSSATIRNEMADLEEMGLIIQPHTSAGRIPSDKGYRLYVDHLMKTREKENNELQEVVVKRVDRLELLLKQMVKVLAANTNYATMITGPQVGANKLKFLQLSRMEEGKLLAEGDPAEVLSRKEVIAAYLGSEGKAFSCYRSRRKSCEEHDFKYRKRHQ